jgi:hypothetical protein
MDSCPQNTKHPPRSKWGMGSEVGPSPLGALAPGQRPGASSRRARGGRPRQWRSHFALPFCQQRQWQWQWPLADGPLRRISYQLGMPLPRSSLNRSSRRFACEFSLAAASWFCGLLQAPVVAPCTSGLRLLKSGKKQRAPGSGRISRRQTCSFCCSPIQTNKLTCCPSPDTPGLAV